MNEEKSMKPELSITGKRGNLLFVNISGLIIGSVFLFFYLLARGLYALPVFVIMAAILAAYMFIDYIHWNKKGIRRIDLFEDSISFTFGKQQTVEKLSFDEITEIDFFKKLNRDIINFMRGGKVLKPVKGITFFSGPRIRLTDDAFDDKEFDLFKRKLKENYSQYKQQKMTEKIN